MKKRLTLLSLLLIVSLNLAGCGNSAAPAESGLSILEEDREISETQIETTTDTVNDDNDEIIRLSEIPPYSGEPYVEINAGMPFFTEDEMSHNSYENYSPLDELGRPQTATACLGPDTMPPDGEERGEIGMIKPAGWHTVKYKDIIDGLYLYNRCHLIGWQLSNENANELNLITGTRYLNVEGMLPFENETADYIRQTQHHVMYRVTPVYTGSNLICNGVLMEASSVEDEQLSFCVYCYNVQPEIKIDYATGDSWLSEETNIAATEEQKTEDTAGNDYILNTNSKKIHRPDCSSAAKTAEHNKQEYHGSIDDLISQGYTPCGICNPE